MRSISSRSLNTNESAWVAPSSLMNYRVRYDSADRNAVSREDGMSKANMLLRHASRQMSTAKRRLADVKELRDTWMGRIKSLADEVDAINYEVQVRLDAAKVASKPRWERLVAPGPSCMAWVDGGFFAIVSAGVIIANIVVMLHESMLRREQRANYSLLDNCFSIFYVFELVMKALRWRMMLLCGYFGIVIWNWIDAVLVVISSLDSWVLPALMPSSADGIGTSNFGFIRILRFLRMCRLLRLTRLAKLARLFIISDLSWTEGDTFETFMVCTIAGNCAVIGLECDFESFFLWPYLEHLFLAIFLFELAVRVKFKGICFFYSGSQSDIIWNWLDVIIVASGVVDQWLLPFSGLFFELLGQSTADAGISVSLDMLRLARIARILRVLKLVRKTPELYTLMITMIGAMRGMFGVLFILIMLLYFSAILCREMIGRGLLFGGSVSEKARDVFPSVPRSVYLLFELSSTGDQAALLEVYAEVPVTELFGMLFTIVSTWGMLSVLTAVVTENMMRAGEKLHIEKISAQKIEACERSRIKLAGIFDRLKGDQDKGQDLDLSIALSALGDELVFEELKDASGLNLVECKNLFKYISRIGDGKDGGPPYITRAAFIDGLQNESRSVSERTIMRLESRLVEVERVLRQGRDTSGKKKLTDCKERRRRGGAKCSTWPGNQSRSLDESSDIVCDREGHVQDAAQSDYGEAQQLRGSRGLGDEQQVE